MFRIITTARYEELKNKHDQWNFYISRLGMLDRWCANFPWIEEVVKYLTGNSRQINDVRNSLFSICPAGSARYSGVNFKCPEPKTDTIQCPWCQGRHGSIIVGFSKVVECQHMALNTVKVYDNGIVVIGTAITDGSDCVIGYPAAGVSLDDRVARHLEAARKKAEEEGK